MICLHHYILLYRIITPEVRNYEFFSHIYYKLIFFSCYYFIFSTRVYISAHSIIRYVRLQYIENSFFFHVLIIQSATCFTSIENKQSIDKFTAIYCFNKKIFSIYFTKLYYRIREYSGSCMSKQKTEKKSRIISPVSDIIIGYIYSQESQDRDFSSTSFGLFDIT